MSSVAERIAEKLLQIKAIKLSPQKPFRWASGKLSPIYCDNRVTLSYPAIRSEIINAFVSEIEKNHSSFDSIVGVATAGIPHGALVADSMDKPFAYIRSKAKEHGRQNLLEGHLEENAKVIVIEDLISTGGSSLKAVEALRQMGHEVLAVYAIFEYGFPIAQQNFTDAKATFYTLSNYEILIEKAKELNYINDQELKMLTDWRSNDQ